MMTLCNAIDNKQMDVVVAFVLHLREVKDFTHTDINRVFEKPHNWESEFAEFYSEFYHFPTKFV